MIRWNCFELRYEIILIEILRGFWKVLNAKVWAFRLLYNPSKIGSSKNKEELKFFSIYIKSSKYEVTNWSSTNKGATRTLCGRSFNLFGRVPFDPLSCVNKALIQVIQISEKDVVYIINGSNSLLTRFNDIIFMFIQLKSRYLVTYEYTVECLLPLLILCKVRN